MAVKRIRKSLNLGEKLKIIQAAENSKSINSIATKFNRDRKTIRTILNDRDRILQTIDQGKSVRLKQIHKVKYPELEQPLLAWIKRAYINKKRVTGDMIKVKATKMANKAGLANFKASNGWLQKFRHRNSILYRKIHGEAAGINTADIEVWNLVLKEQIKNYSADDIYNLDEMGLLWKALPDKTMVFKEKISKDRITVMLCSNMSGQDKIKPLVIGHYANPRCFRNNRPRCVDYVANSTAWMTGPIFETWLDNWNKKLSNEGRKILLYMDNFSGHTEMELSNIVIKFLPPNTTARTQPLDQGIIKNLKLFYRQQLLQNHVDALDVEQEYNPNLLDALRMLKKAWDKVKPSTIINCFRHAGFVVDNQTQAIEVAENDELNELEELWNRLKLSHDLEFYPNLQDYLSIDDLMDINENGSPQLEAETDVEMEVSDSDPSQLDAEYMTFESLLDDPGNVIPPSHDGGITFPEDYDYMPYEELLDMPQEVPRVVLKLKKAGNAWKANDPFYNEYED